MPVGIRVLVPNFPRLATWMYTIGTIDHQIHVPLFLSFRFLMNTA
jgi:hypothetical protein